ncbi:MAG: HAD family hydrolase [Dysgonomonas sp.]|nr:HAD family hydrolase [Dysgonomonas sp.]
MIKHISFDLWLTLIKSHPSFKRLRAELIADVYNTKGLTTEEIDILIRNTDKEIDRNNESTGGKLPARLMYYKILEQTCPESEDVLIQKAKTLEIQSNELFIKNIPLLLNDNISDILSWLKAEGYSLNLGSNTGFIEADTLRIVLDDLGLLQFFSFCVFSDEIKTSKPSPLFFQEIYDQTNFKKEEILHVGDNPLTDYQGASDFGLNALLITNRDYTLDDIKSGLQRNDYALLGFSNQLSR